MGSRVLDPGVPVLAEAALADRVERPAPVLVLFYADWCPFCEAFLPSFQEIAPKSPIAAVAANVSHPGDARWDVHGIDAIPTVVAFQGGEEISRVEAVPGQGLGSDAFQTFVEGLEASQA